MLLQTFSAAANPAGLSPVPPCSPPGPVPPIGSPDMHAAWSCHRSPASAGAAADKKKCCAIRAISIHRTYHEHYRVAT
jgi:hypothetical protein